jgi:hypothetical protein
VAALPDDQGPLWFKLSRQMEAETEVKKLITATIAGIT